MESTQKALLINTHLTYPNWSEGRLNNAFQQVAKDFLLTEGFEILETKVEKGYNPEQEVEKHLQSDIIILQTPINWFGAPWIYKKYVDEVFNSGLHSAKFLSGDGRSRENTRLQYGTSGKMQGKKFMVCATWNAPAASFDDPNQHLFQGISTKDYLLHITSNYRFCGVEVVADYNCFDIFKDGDIANDLLAYPQHLKKAFLL